MSEGRYELKFHITAAQYRLLHRRFAAALPCDAHAGPDGYRVDSLYYDDACGRAYQEKLDGVPGREKFRLRAYNGSDDFIRLECKQRQHAFIYKTAASLGRAEYGALLTGDVSFMKQSANLPPVCRQFLAAWAGGGLRPVVTVRYHRVAFCGPAGSRITFDSRLSAGVHGLGLFAGEELFVFAGPPGMVVMEVKFSGALPALPGALLRGLNVQAASISKYALCAQKRLEVTKRWMG